MYGAKIASTGHDEQKCTHKPLNGSDNEAIHINEQIAFIFNKFTSHQVMAKNRYIGNLAKFQLVPFLPELNFWDKQAWVDLNSFPQNLTLAYQDLINAIGFDKCNNTDIVKFTIFAFV